MTPEIAIVFAILLGAIVLFVTEWVRLDVVALMVLVSVALTGLVSPAEAFSGFSNPAVITVWAMFIISAGLSLTGVAERIGARLARIAGTGEVRMIAAIMATAGLLSAIMNNVGVAAMMLPVVIDLARRTGRAPSRLLLPLAMGSLLGGLTTLIGTPPNILVSDALREAGLAPFELFDFTPIGAVLLVTGTAYVAIAGRHLLPRRDPLRETASRGRDRGERFEFGEHLVTIRLPRDSPLDGRTLGESRLGSALRVNVVAIVRAGQTQLAPHPTTALRGGDRLVAVGRHELLAEYQQGTYLVRETRDLASQTVILEALQPAETLVPEDSPLVGRTLFQSGLRTRLGISVLAIRRSGEPRHPAPQDVRIQAGDRLLLHGSDEAMEKLGGGHELEAPQAMSATASLEAYALRERLMTLGVPEDSILAGRTLAESRLRDAFGLAVWAIHRDGRTHAMPSPDETLEPGDLLLVEGTPEKLETLASLRELEIERQPLNALAQLESADVGLAEVVLSPETTLEGKTLRELEFRDRYGLSVLAIWRHGEAHRTNLRDMALHFGDAILLHGPREKLRLLAGDPDLLVISELAAAPPLRRKAPVALVILAAVLAPVILGWIPIALAAVAGATLMVLTGCLSMKDAYRHIEWRAVFLIAGMLPLGIAMDRTGAARLVADSVIAATSGLGPRGVLAGLFLSATLAAQVIPTAAVVVLMAPVALTAAFDLGLSPFPFMMALAMAASPFSSPVSHPVNTLVMGPGGYRFSDYIRIGLPLSGLVFVLVVLLVPVFWPF